MVPIVIVLICIGWRILKRIKAEEKEENDFSTVKSRAIDPDESLKINSDDESIPYKKDTNDDSPQPTDPVNIQPYGFQPYDQGVGVNIVDEVDAPTQPLQNRQWTGETEIN